MIKIVADDKIPFLKGVLEPFAIVEYYPGEKITNQLIKDADALLIRTRTKCNRDLLENTNVRFIATATIGYDHIDIKYCQQNNIKWTNAPGCNSGSVMQYVASALIRLSLKYNFEFRSKTIGIVGCGNVGSKVALLADVLGMKVLINDPPLQRTGKLSNAVSINKIIKEADIITFHVPLILKGKDRTYYLASKDFFSKIKEGSIIINTSRGEVIDSEWLKKSLIEKKINAAVLDVWEKEPLIDEELVKMVDIATPHIAGYSVNGKANGTAMAVQAISDFFGFGFVDWYPENKPKPENREIKLPLSLLNFHEIVSHIILNTYDVSIDDMNLRKSIQSFEKQRGEYGRRFEFNDYFINIGESMHLDYEKILLLKKNCNFVFFQNNS